MFRYTALNSDRLSIFCELFSFELTPRGSDSVDQLYHCTAEALVSTLVKTRQAKCGPFLRDDGGARAPSLPEVAAGFEERRLFIR